MNRKAKRLIQNKLGQDFPLDKLLAVYGYYAKSYNMSLDDFMIKVLREYTEEKYQELAPILERMSEDDTI